MKKEERDKEAMKYAQKYRKVNPLDGLPEYLKDPKNFYKINKALLETLSCGKLHSELKHVYTCKKCTENMILRKDLMVQFGFKDAKQYLAWKKTHFELKRRMPLDMYNHMVK